MERYVVCLWVAVGMALTPSPQMIDIVEAEERKLKEREQAVKEIEEEDRKKKNHNKATRA